jgi:hypothetical protein
MAYLRWKSVESCEEKSWQSKKLINGLRRTYVSIATTFVGFKKNKLNIALSYTLEEWTCVFTSLFIYKPVHGGMWYQEIKYTKDLFRACELIALIFPGSLHMKAARLDCSSCSFRVMPSNMKIPQTPVFMSERNVYLHLNIAILRLCRLFGLQSKGTIIDQS